jgi:Tfp pilus assembly major pilin PilA
MEKKYSFQYETEANASFLVASLENAESLIQYQIKMLENNSIPHLLDIKKYRSDDTVQICYNVTSRLSLAQATARQKMSKEEFLTLLENLVESCRELQEYQLPLCGLLLEEDYIFVKCGSFEPNFVYMPIYAEDNGMESIRSFVRKMVLESKIAVTKDNFVQQILDLFNEADLTLENLHEQLLILHRPTAPVNNPEPIKAPEPPVFAPVQQIEDNVNAAVPEKAQPTPKILNKQKSVKEREKEKSKPDKAKSAKTTGSSKKNIFILLQVLAVVLVVLAARSGFFTLEDGGINVSYIAGIVILIAGLDFVLYREFFVNSKSVSAEAKRSSGKKESKGKAKGMKAKKEIQEKSARFGQRTEQKTEQATGQGTGFARPDFVASAREDAAVQSPVSAPEPAPAAVPPVYVPTAAPVYSALDIDEGENTVVDDGENFDDGYLEYFENGLVKRIHLQEGVTRVGSLARSVDYVLPSNRVSKIHAEFVRQGTCYFVRDINSTNGTYLNGSKNRLVSNQNFELHNGDTVKLANMELVFRC